MSRLPLPALQVHLLRRDGDRAVALFVEAILDVIRGNEFASTTYLSSREKLGLPVQELTRNLSQLQLEKTAKRAMHSLFVDFIDSVDAELTSSNSCLNSLVRLVRKPEFNSGLLIVCRDDASSNRLQSAVGDADDNIWIVNLNKTDPQGWQQPSWGEHVERPVWFALYVLFRARHLLLEGTGKDPAKRLTMFLSHAKKDGLPLARAFEPLLSRQEWLAAWYDAKDLQNVKDWRNEIREGVVNSIVVVLRTNAYETRPWCRQEFMWARERGVPFVNVEVRYHFERPSDMLTHDAAPTVWLTDGNLFRVLFTALRENIRLLVLERFYHELKSEHSKKFDNATLIAYPPTLTQIAQSIAAINPQSGKEYLILHQDPPLRGVVRHAVSKLLDAYPGEIRLGTPQELIIEWG
ncbi:MAG: toll/interleukin-1 receptor domain-containing protein [Planctomycetota bacterium]|jgi:hypothetical protein